MIKVKQIIISFLLLSSFHVSLFSMANEKENSYFKIYLYMEKATFENNESILLYINIKNTSKTKRIFKICDMDYTTFQPVVYNMNGKEAETLVAYRLQNKTVTEILKDSNSRTIELLPNELFSHIIDLKTIYKIDSEKEYRVKAQFSPDVENLFFIKSDNQLNFKTLKDVGDSGDKISRISQFTSPIRNLSPSEIILLFLKAEKERNWDNYFKFIDIEKYINAYPDYVRIYNIAIKKHDIEQKEKIVLEFTNFLKEERSDYIISYNIVSELNQSENNCYVEALVKRSSAGSPFIYKYRYALEKFENLWLITDVVVTVNKGQKI
ncbi:MAG: hypothetical protein V1874_02625 [Spirochaetota bacterium]